MPASSSGLGMSLLWRQMGFSLNKCVFYMHINFPRKFHQNAFTLTITFIVLNVSIEFVLIYRPHPVFIFWPMTLFKYDDRDWSRQLSCIPFPVNLPGPRGWLSQVNIPAERAGLKLLQKHVSAVPSIVQLSRLFGRLS